MSNLEKIAALEKTMLTPADVAEYLESDAESIRLQARANAAALGFPVIVMGNRVKIPKEGFDFLTEEQAKAKMYAESEHFFAEYVAQCYMLEKLTGRTVKDVVNERLSALAAGVGMTVDAVIRQSGEAMIYEKFASESAMEALSEYTKQLLEE